MSTSHKKAHLPTFKPRPLGLRKGLAEMYQGELLCDATLITDGQRFPCHRALLAAVSPYFRDLFVNTWEKSDGGEVLLQEVAPSIVQSILNYVYTEELTLTPEWAPNLFAGACQLQITPLQDLCCRFLVTNLSMQNCFGMYSLAQEHKNWALLHASVQFLTKHFERIFEDDHFLQLDLNTLTSLISSSNLGVASELKVYQAVRRWVQFQASERGPLLGELVAHVRFPLFTAEEQAELHRDLVSRGDLELEWEEMGGEERLEESRGLREGMYDLHILCVDTQMCDYQELETTDMYMSCYEPQAEAWEKLPGLRCLTHACCTTSGDKVYVSGGIYKNVYSSAFYEFNAFTCYWTQLPSMSVPRVAHGFLFCDHRLFALGGWRKFQSFLCSAESFDLATEKWAAIPNLPVALSHPASSVFRNKLYLLGGATGIVSQWMFHRGLLIYEVSSGTWTQVPLANGFFGAGAVAADSGIYVIGGFLEKKNRDSVESSVVPENRHTTRKCFFINEAGNVSHATSTPRLPCGVANAGVVQCSRRIYVLGGEDLSQRYKTIYHWEPGEPRWHRSDREIPVPREGISRFGCATLMRPKPHILQLFEGTSLVPVGAVSK